MTSSGTAPKRPGPRQAATDKFHNYKVCKKCGEKKRLADFHKSPNWRKYLAANPKRYQNDCKQCRRALNATEVDPNFKPDRSPALHLAPIMGKTEDEHREYRARYKRRKRRETRVKVVEYLADKGCCECGNRDPRVLEFDHIDPAKKDRCISRMLSDGYDWGNEKLREEIRKCRILCANCHRIHTIGQQGNYAHADVQASLAGIYERYGITK